MKQSSPIESSKRTNSSLLVAFVAVLGIGVFIATPTAHHTGNPR
jgi:hypothetical protein